MNTADQVIRPLAGLVVIDLVEGALAPLSRLYADLGAEVVRVERRDVAEPAGAGERISQQIGALGKQTLRLDPSEASDVEALEQLLLRADIVIRSAASVYDSAVEATSPRRPELVVMTVSPFGQDNPYSTWQATDPVLHALSGELCRSGLRGREPLLPPGEIALKCALTQAAYAGLVAVFRALATGRGDHIDFSALDGAVQALDPGFGAAGSATYGRPAKLLSPQRPQKGFQYPIFACADGHVRVCLLSPRQWQGMFRWMGEPEQFAGPAFMKTTTRYRSSELTAALETFFFLRTRSELEAQGQGFGVPIAALRSLEECLTADHLSAREAFRTVRLAGGGVAPVPNGVIEIDGVRMGPRVEPAPPPPPLPAAAPRAAPSARPLEGLKVLDLGVIVVGAEQGRLLADAGADVVKVETSAFPDGSRQSYLPTGLSVSFAAGHRNERSLGLNLRDPKGKAIFLRLASEADVVLSNFKPGTLESLGLGHTDLLALNPAIITVESSAFGSHGPWAARMGYGPLVRAAAGVTGKWRYADDPESYSDSITVYPDHVAGRIGVIAVLALLIRRLRTGKGGAAKISQLEVMLDQFATAIAGRALGEESIEEPPDAPWGVFRAAGEDEWCVVTVRDDDDWRRLAPVLGCDQPEYETREERLAALASLNRVLSEWVSSRTSEQAMEELQSLGVPAGRMLRISELPEFGYFRSRGFYRTERHPHMDEEVVAERFPIWAKNMPEAPSRPAPLMGEHTAEIMREWLGLSDGEIDVLLAAGVLEPVAPEIRQLIVSGEGRRAAEHV